MGPVQDPALQQLLAIFRDEAHEGLDALGQYVAGLGLSSGPAFDEVIDKSMRIAHNLKGASASVGLDDMARITHAFEDVLLAMRQGRLSTSRENACDELARSVSAMANLVDSIPVDAAATIAHLSSLISGGVRLDAALAQPGPAKDEDPDFFVIRSDVEVKAEPRGVGPAVVARPQGVSVAVQAKAEPRGVGPAVVARPQGVRVAVDRLDELVRFAGELLAIQAEAQERHTELEQGEQWLQSQLDELDLLQRGVVVEYLARLDGQVRRNRDAMRRLSRLTSELSDAVRRMRMIPVSALAATFRRSIADAAQVTNRDAELQMLGGDVELDKQVLDRIAEPVLHLLRNAVDHGLEDAEERVRKGKPRRGRVLVDARPDGDLVELSVHDDGRGIDVQRLRDTALARGMRTHEQLDRMSQTELFELMFETGFTTATKVSQISGRGLGLDVVRRTVEDCGGRLDLHSPGRLGGTSFCLLLPVDVLSVHALTVRAASGTFALPIDAVERTLRFERASVRELGRESVLDVEGQPLRLRALAASLGLRQQQSSTRARRDGVAVVLRRGGRVLALEVDEVLSDQEHAIKRLPWNLRSVAGVAGVVALPDSGVAVALDASHLLRSAGELVRGTSAAEPAAKVRVLVADDSLTARTLAKNALVAAGYAVTAVVDGAKAWQALLDEDYALLVSDVRMPNLDGVELTRRVRGDERLRKLPVVLITTESTAQDIERGLSAGADEYVIKGPMQQQKLLEAVARHV
ncbi:MAG TPA: response regulator [Polyangiaceae bacterium]|nr:response regulator [Polyangiaceae bacterium]